MSPFILAAIDTWTEDVWICILRDSIQQLSTGVEITQVRSIYFRAGICTGDACGPTWFKVACSSKAYPGQSFQTLAEDRVAAIYYPLSCIRSMMDKSTFPICCLRQVGGHSWRHRMFPMSRESIDRRAQSIIVSPRAASGLYSFKIRCNTGPISLAI